MTLREWFTDHDAWQEKKEKEARLKSQADTVWHGVNDGDAAKTTAALQNIEDKEYYLANFYTRDMKLVIEKGKLAVFQAMLTCSGDTNLLLTERMNVGTSENPRWIEYNRSPLYYAIQSRSHDIALALLNNPDTKVESSGNKGNENFNILNIIDEMGDSDVHAKLLVREEAAVRKKAEEVASKLNHDADEMRALSQKLTPP